MACTLPAAGAERAAHATPASASQAASSALPTASWGRAQCVAALEVQAEAVAARIKSGETAAGLNDQLRELLRAGAAFIGQAYLAGERDEDDSKALLERARQAQEVLSPAELSARQQSCLAQGNKTMAETNAIGRALLSRLAERRMKRMLGS